MSFSQEANQDNFPFKLPPLPYKKEDLIPYLSAESFDYHYDKHHAAYVTNLNKFLESESELQNMSLEEIITYSENNSLTAIFNNAAQVWNHTFFWHSMKQNGGGKPSGEILDLLNSNFGSYDKFAEEFKQAGISQFGSGWVWLVKDSEGRLKIVKTPNAHTPITSGYTALIACDVWEHAYYIDYRNKRPDFLSIFLDKLVNWDFAAKNLQAE